MEKLFYEEPYVRVFTARVVSCSPVKRGFEIELDRTAFYPEGGGQPSDTGTLGEAHVLDVQERDGRIFTSRIWLWKRALQCRERSTGRNAFPTCSSILESILCQG